MSLSRMPATGAAPLLPRMNHSDFSIGLEFYTGSGKWRCTDVGTRVIVAISLEPHAITVSWEDAQGRHDRHEMSDDPSWFNGHLVSFVATLRVLPRYGYR